MFEWDSQPDLAQPFPKVEKVDIAAMAEWFKATDLRPVIYDAWVRTPLAAKIKTN